MTTRKTPMKRSVRSKSAIGIPLSQTEQNTQFSDASPISQRTRAKKYTKDETDALLMFCAEFHGIINKNSSSEADRKIKSNAWETIKRKFDEHCQLEGIYVSILFVLAARRSILFFLNIMIH